MIAALVGFANFFWFVAESSALGGDALNGTIRGGHYYVSSHGALTEVSQGQWYWSRAHAISVFGTHLLAMVGMAFLLFRVFFPAMLPSPSPDDAERLVAVRASGPEIAGGRVAGQLGDLRLSGPLLDVAVHPGGMVLRPPFMRPVVLLADELEGVSWDRSWGQHRLTIAYRPGVWLGPIRAFVRPGDQLAVAIERLVSDSRVPRPSTPTLSTSTAHGAPISGPARLPKYPLVMKVWIVVALVLSVAFLLTWASPGLNPKFLFGLAIVAGNVYWWLIRDRRRW